jgi:hypothetical protein
VGLPKGDLDSSDASSSSLVTTKSSVDHIAVASTFQFLGKSLRGVDMFGLLT